MGYKSIISEIKDFYANDLTMESFKELKEIGDKINVIYQKALSKKKIDAKVNYNAMLAYLNEVVFYKLKETLHFEDEVINNIIRLINYGDKIVDIYVFDGNVVGILNNNDKEESYLIPNDTFIEITKIDFAKLSSNKNFKKSLINSLNTVLGTLFNGEEVLKLNENVDYEINYLNIYINPTINKILVKYEDNIMYYDIKIIDNELVLANNEYKVNYLSSILESNSKRK